MNKRKEYYRKWYEANKEKIKEYSKANKEKRKEYSKANKEKRKEYNKAYNEANKEKRKEYNKAYNEANKEKRKEYQRNKMKTDIQYKLSCNLRTRLRGALNGGYKVGSAVRDLGCSIEYFKEYVSSKFKEGMTWDNYGLYGWHLDHIVPLSSFNLTDRGQFLTACHYTNYQPLWCNDNLSKNDDCDPCDLFFYTEPSTSDNLQFALV